MSIDLSGISYVSTPAACMFVSLLESGAEDKALTVLDEHWLELWYAFDPSDLKALLLSVPREAFGTFRNAGYLNTMVGVDIATPAAASTQGDEDDIDTAAHEIADLRLAGRPQAAMAKIMAFEDNLRQLRGRLVDVTGGRVPIYLIQSGITAFLAGELTTARAWLQAVPGSHRPDRFPFVEREAMAKLALLHAVAGSPAEAAEWLARAAQAPQTVSWVEKMIDDSLRLTRYICAIDALDLDCAEEMRRADPSPFAHLEFWGVALHAQVRHLCLTGRREQARRLCDDTAAAGLPLPDSDGWLGSMLNDAYLMCAPLGEAQSPRAPCSPGEAVLAQRLHNLATGQYRQLLARDATVLERLDAHVRTRLGLELLRGQGLLHSGRVDDGRTTILTALERAFEQGTLGVLRFLTAETLDLIADTDLGARARRLVQEKQVCLVEVVAALESPLTPAEIRVMRLLAEGLSRQQIAEASYVSLDTVKSQLASAYRKLRARNREDAVTRFERLGG